MSIVRLLAILIHILAVTIFAGEAFGHAALTGSHPADRATLATAPDEITLQFNEAVSPIRLQLTDHEGHRWPLADVAARDNVIHLRPGETLPQGLYILSYRVTSADSHPVGGSLLFAIGPASDGWNEATPRPEPSVGPWATAAWRSLYLACVMIATGAALFLLLVCRHAVQSWARLQSLLIASAAAGAVLALSQIGLQGALLAGDSWMALLSPETWALGWASTRGTALCVAAAGLVTIAIGSRLGATARGSALLAAGSAAAVLSFALSGHMATAASRVFVIMIHVTAAAFWIGSFLPLLLTLRAEGQQTAGHIQTFSRIAVFAVAALFAAGLTMVLLQISSWAQFTGTDYGRLLIAKIVLASLLLAIAAGNKLILAPRLGRGSTAVTWLARTIRAEFVIGIAILISTAFLAQTPPAQIVAPREHAPDMGEQEYTQVIAAHGKQAFVTRVTANGRTRRLLIRFADEDGKPFAPIEVTLIWSNASRGVEPILREAESTDGGAAYRYDGPELALPISWNLRIDALVSDFERVSFFTELPAR